METYQEMNDKIIEILRMAGSAHCLYAAARIQELETANAKLLLAQTSRSVDPEGHMNRIDDATLDECTCVLMLAVRYLGHPEVKEIGFVLPSAAVARRANAAIARLKAARRREASQTLHTEKGGNT